MPNTGIITHLIIEIIISQQRNKGNINVYLFSQKSYDINNY